MIGFFLGKI